MFIANCDVFIAKMKIGMKCTYVHTTKFSLCFLGPDRYTFLLKQLHLILIMKMRKFRPTKQNRSMREYNLFFWKFHGDLMWNYNLFSLSYKKILRMFEKWCISPETILYYSFNFSSTNASLSLISFQCLFFHQFLCILYTFFHFLVYSRVWMQLFFFIATSFVILYQMCIQTAFPMISIYNQS